MPDADLLRLRAIRYLAMASKLAKKMTRISLGASLNGQLGKLLHSFTSFACIRAPDDRVSSVARPKMGRRIGFHADQAARLRNGTCAAVGAAICAPGPCGRRGLRSLRCWLHGRLPETASEEVLVSAFPTVALGPTNANRASPPTTTRAVASAVFRRIANKDRRAHDTGLRHGLRCGQPRCPSCRYYSRRGSQVMPDAFTCAKVDKNNTIITSLHIKIFTVNFGRS